MPEKLNVLVYGIRTRLRPVAPPTVEPQPRAAPGDDSAPNPGNGEPDQNPSGPRSNPGPGLGDRIVEGLASAPSKESRLVFELNKAAPAIAARLEEEVQASLANLPLTSVKAEVRFLPGSVVMTATVAIIAWAAGVALDEAAKGIGDIIRLCTRRVIATVGSIAALPLVNEGEITVTPSHSLAPSSTPVPEEAASGWMGWARAPVGGEHTADPTVRRLLVQVQRSTYAGLSALAVSALILAYLLFDANYAIVARPSGTVLAHAPGQEGQAAGVLSSVPSGKTGAP